MLARKIILGFGFAVLLPLLVHYGIDVFWPEPDRTASYREQSRLYQQRNEATSKGEKADIQRRLDVLEDARHQAQQRSSRIHFFIGAPLGVVTTLIGSFIGAQAIGGGLMLGGIFTFTGGCFWYWGDLSRVGRFAVLLVAFVVLIWIGYQRLSELKQPAKTS